MIMWRKGCHQSTIQLPELNSSVLATTSKSPIRIETNADYTFMGMESLNEIPVLSPKFYSSVLATRSNDFAIRAECSVTHFIFTPRESSHQSSILTPEFNSAIFTTRDYDFTIRAKTKTIGYCLTTVEPIMFVNIDENI